VEFQYAINPYSEEPIFQINEHIGYDEEDGQGIDGVKFSREVFEIDSLQPKLITFYHNCYGGDIKQGYDMLNAIINAKSKTKSIIAGFCYSTDGWLALSTDRVEVYDYSTWMCHLPYDPKNIDKKDELIIIVAKRIATVISAKSGRNGKPKKTPEEILDMMTKKTYYTAEDMYNNGLCDIVLNSNNKKISLSNLEDSKEIKKNYKEYQVLFNKLLPNNNNDNINNNTMAYEKLVNKINKTAELNQHVGSLAEGSDETAIVAQWANLENAYNFQNKENVRIQKELDEVRLQNKVLNDSQEENQKRMKEMQNSNDSMTNEIAELKDKYNLMCSEKTAMDNKAKEDALKILTDNATKLINKHVGVGRIKDEEGIKNKWIEKAVTNYDDTELLLDSMQMNMHVPKPVNLGNDAQPQTGTSASDKYRLANRERIKKETIEKQNKFLGLVVAE
jgi:ATP-dependent protease ClpP protease subunit